MAMTSRKNVSLKALQSHIATDKKTSARALLEWLMACNTNNKRGPVWDQSDINSHYSRDVRRGDAHGATKVCHTKNHLGQEFKYIVVKRFSSWGMEIDGNQLISEIECWNDMAETPDADCLCPILKYFTSKSDKVDATSETMKNNVVIIAQKASDIGDAEDACKAAERLNNKHGLHGESWRERYSKLESLARRKHWRDVMHNVGNSGVIFDYAQGCYKAVFIDYAL